MIPDAQFPREYSAADDQSHRRADRPSGGKPRLKALAILTASLCALIIGNAIQDVVSADEMPPMPPIANDDSDFSIYNEFVIIDILYNDSAGSTPLAPYSVTIVTQPQFGTATVDLLTGLVAYVPDGTSAGLDWFEYTVEDETGQVSNSARVDIYLMNMPPSIDTFQAVPGAGDTWTFTGHISDENPGAMSVDLGGVISVANVPVETDGSFSTTVVLDPNTFGTVTAVTEDEFGAQSDTPSVIVGSPPGMGEMPPTANDDWDFANYNEFVVIDILNNDSAGSAPLAAYSVTIVTQPQFGTATVDPLTGLVAYVPDGNSAGLDWFEYTVEDESGQVSNSARVDVYLMNMPPTIDNFQVHAGTGNTWTFTGQVNDENSGDASVSLGGIVDEPNVTVQADGSFSITIQLAPNAFGTVTADAVDEFGEPSDTVYITAGQF